MSAFMVLILCMAGFRPAGVNREAAPLDEPCPVDKPCDVAHLPPRVKVPLPQGTVKREAGSMPALYPQLCAASPARVTGSSGNREGGARALTRKPRSEEHTSELQSLMRISYAVFCLKKKKNTRQNKEQDTSKQRI